MSRNTLLWKRIGSTLGVVGGLAVAANAAAWIWSADRLSASIEKQAEALRARGWKIVTEPLRRTGWPVRARIEVGPASIAAAGLILYAESVTADAALLQQDPLIVRSAGHQLRFGQRPPVPITSQKLLIEPRTNSASVKATDIDVANTVKADVLQMQVEAARLLLTAQNLHFSNASQRPAPSIDAIGVSVELTKPIPRAVDPHAAAIEWRDIGGTANVLILNVTMQGVNASGHATLSLDASLQPKLDGIIHVVGYQAGLDTLTSLGLLKAQTATAAKAVLDLLAAPSADGGADIPVRIADGVLSAGQFSLLRLPALDWPSLTLPQ